jgi:hypothetical protein
MKINRMFLPIALLALTGVAAVRAGTTIIAGGEVRPDTLVWCGLDYSKVKMIGTEDFRHPENIFPEMLIEWNGLFIKEQLSKLEMLDATVQSDMDAIIARNAKASASQIERKDGTHSEMVDASDLTTSDLAKTVRSYKLKHGKGLGLVFIMDRLVKAQETGCIYVVFFDIDSRRVLYSERLCEKAGGFGFRNYWFSPVKSAVRKLPGMYQQAKLKKK